MNAALERYRQGRPAGEAEPAGDPTLLSLVENPYTSTDDAERRLGALREALEEREDRRAIFLSIYHRVTGEVSVRIDRGGFEDPDWVADYLVTFADLYRDAFYTYEAGDLHQLPDPWQIAFETADGSEALVMQDAVLGVNAHINYDLAYALDRVGIDPNRTERYADHRAVTEVLARLVDETQESLATEYAPGIETIDEALGRVDERVTIFTIDQCRDSAWRSAVGMASRIPFRRRLAEWLTHATSTGIAHLILSSRASITVHDTIREFESGAPGSSG